MKNLILISVATLFIISCSPNAEKESDLWSGSWQAKWSTDPASFGEIEGITDYTMDGAFIFDSKKLNIKAYGFDGCVFSTDTLDHNLMWSVKGDSLILINDDATPGMIYKINAATENKVELQLLDDIMLTLTK